MKFQKGLLDDLKPQARALRETQVNAPVKAGEQPAFNEKDHLFETQQGWSQSSKNYLKMLGILAVFVAIAGVTIGYMTLPVIGDAVRAPKGLETAVHEHFLLNEKRAMTDVTFYYCGDHYWARVQVEKRPDIKTNPIYMIDRYSARATQIEEEKWAITALPITASEQDTPCSQPPSK